MNDIEKIQLEKMLKTIKESTENIVSDENVTPEIIRNEIYNRGLAYLGNNRNLQNIIDIGVLGLSLYFKENQNK
jgi:hypothetical protein